MHNIFSFPESKYQKQGYGQLCGGSLSLALAEYCDSNSGVKLLIPPDNLSAYQLLNEIQFFQDSNKQEILLFPDWETLPYDQFSPHQDIISERLKILTKIANIKFAKLNEKHGSKSNKKINSENIIIIAAASTIMHQICPPEFLNMHSLVFSCSQNLDINSFRLSLQNSGYYAVNTVLEHGEFSVRGSIIDLFPMGSFLPVRIELFDNEIESLRYFDPDSQLTINKVKKISILPAREFPLTEDGIGTFRNAFRNEFHTDPTKSPIYEAVSKGKVINGIEYYLPLFFEKSSSIFDYLTDDAHICRIANIEDSANQFWGEVKTRYEQLADDITRPILPPTRCFIPPNELSAFIGKFKQLKFFETHIIEKPANFNFDISSAKSFPINRKSNEPLSNLAKEILNSEHKFLIVAESAGRQEMLLEILKQSSINPQKIESWHKFLCSNNKVNITIGSIGQGFKINNKSITIITESQLFGEQATVIRRKSNAKVIDPDVIIRDLVELRIGAPVVHIQFGVGRYLGLQTFDNDTNEFLILAYADDAKIYVPVTSLHLISRYTGADADHAPLHKLGSTTWTKEKNKALEKINDVAIELLEIYAKREASTGFQYEYNSKEYQRFINGFTFTETDDQLKAIDEIIKDMQNPKPMDRLICGDVGFGKTEVAMRAAFIAAQNNKQVCILAPTTLLAGQHYETFRERFVDFPINVDLLSRFRTSKEANKVIESIENGKIDIIIGTHKLFQKNIKFKNLGLLIIDEEHRFGVKQKDHMKALRAHIDVLCMTATPIPRTLNMSMSGIRDISLIASPPAKRLAIKTFWQEHNNIIIKEAILRETFRGGQVFFLHNNVQTIEKICIELQELIPEATIRYAHGQMRESDLERIMSDFYHHKFNVLVCTTIIETGIDIPTANTIIIDRADKFGLAQLHQLRGRVGRSHHQAYAYLLSPNSKLITEDAKKRLEAIVSFEDLGAGFTLATLDMEIRGAGELLGDGQSGNMHAIGFNLYIEMLNRAVHSLKSNKTPELSFPINNGPEIDLRMPAIIPDTYISDVHYRLIMYKRISNATNKSQLHDLQIELIDRYGLLPEQVKLLFAVTELKFQAVKMGIIKISAANSKGTIEFDEKPHINSFELIKLIQMHSTKYRLEGPTKLRFTLESEEHSKIITEISSLLNNLA